MATIAGPSLLYCGHVQLCPDSGHINQGFQTPPQSARPPLSTDCSGSAFWELEPAVGYESQFLFISTLKDKQILLGSRSSHGEGSLSYFCRELMRFISQRVLDLLP